MSIDEKYDHKWGYSDTQFEVRPNKAVIFTGDRYELCGYEIPGLIPFVEDIFEVELDLDSPKALAEPPVLPEPKIEPKFKAAMETIFGEERLLTDDRQRLIHSHGQTTADEVYQVLYSSIERVCDLVVFVETEDEVAQLVKAATEHDVCLVPYGGGTSVSCALKLPSDETRTIVVVDMRKLSKIVEVDKENLKATVQAGITGSALEEQLAAYGVMCGHEPDSMEFSTLGGWIATNASGMKKNRYGNIEQIVESITMVTPKGEIKQLSSLPRTSLGIAPKQLSFGSEGNLGFITKAVINVHPRPAVTKFDSLVFKDWETGVEFMRQLSKAKVLPASIRLVDNIQFRSGQALKPAPDKKEELIGKAQKNFLTKVKKFDPYKMVAATIMMEGSKAEVDFQNSQIKKLASKFGAVVGGASNGKRGYMLTYAIAYIRDFLNTYEIIGETYETTVPWDKIIQVCEAVDKRAKELHAKHGLPGVPYVSPRVTQTYHTGVCIYFTHGFSCKGVENPGELFAEIERDLRQTILDNGGSLSHHHGIGKLRAEFMDQVISESSIDLVKDIKKAADPDNIFGIGNGVLAAQND